MWCGAERCNFIALTRSVHGTAPIAVGKQVTRVAKYVLCRFASATGFSCPCISTKRGIKMMNCLHPWFMSCSNFFFYYQFLPLLLERRVAWPDRTESCSNEGASSWEGHPSWRGRRVQAGREVTHSTSRLKAGREALTKTSRKERSSLFEQLRVVAKATNVFEAELLWRHN